MPFGFGRKKEAEEPAAPPPAPVVERVTRFEGFTEEWRLEGEMDVSSRMLDLLNLREPVPVRNVTWAPLDGSSPFEPAPGIQTIDPYDLIVVLVRADRLTERSDDERSAHRIHKVTFDIALEAPPFRIVGSVQLHPGTAPEALLDRGSQMFTAITNPTIHLGDVPLDLGGAEAVLVNRMYLRGVLQVDPSTGQPYGATPSA